MPGLAGLMLAGTMTSVPKGKTLIVSNWCSRRQAPTRPDLPPGGQSGPLPRPRPPHRRQLRRSAMAPATLEQHDFVEAGDRMLICCNGGPSLSRLVLYPPPLEIEACDGVYVLVDDGPPELWRYDFVRRIS